jgi:hypothetical protein
MGGVVRRTSTAMTFNTPLRRKSSASSAKLRGETDSHQKTTSMDSGRDSGKGSSREGSIRSVQLDTSARALTPPPPAVDDAPQQPEQQQEPQPEMHAAPSPIAESPMREAASLREEEQGQEQQQKQQKPELPIPHHLKPSPLAHEVIPSPITPILDTQPPTEDGGSIKAPVIFDEPDTMSMAGSIATVPKTDEPVPKGSQQEEPTKTEPQSSPVHDGVQSESSKASEEPPVQPEEHVKQEDATGGRPVDLAVAQPPSEPKPTPVAATTPPSEPAATKPADEEGEQTFHIMPVPSSNPGTQTEYDSPFIAPRGEGQPPSDRAFFISTPPMEKTEGQSQERVQHVTFEDGLRDIEGDGEEVQGANETARENWRGQPANAGPSAAVG